MRTLLVEVSQIDRQAEAAAKRIAKALSMDLTEPVISTSLDDISFLRVQIRDLQRRNLELSFLVYNPGFDVDDEVAYELKWIKDFSSQNGDRLIVQARYSYEFFEQKYHPEFVVRVCEFLCNVYVDRDFKPFELWVALIKTNGIINKEIVKYFGPIDVPEKGIIE
jgi:hypothetical protein